MTDLAEPVAAPPARAPAPAGGLDLRALTAKLDLLRDNVQKVFLGHPDSVDLLLTGLLARGHVLVEDVPGVGKTVLCKCLAKSIDCKFSRVQLTPDLLPADVLGVSVYNQTTGDFDFKPGPIFANIVVADEVNRTTPRTQSALLEAMAEGQVSIEGRTIPLGRPFMVVATQNPFEFEGTYQLPENQLDRFILRVKVGYPPREAEAAILRQQPGREPLDALGPVMDAGDVVALQEAVQGVRFDPSVLGYLLDLVEATRHHEQLHLGVSPRGSLALADACRAFAVVSGRDHVLPDDVKAMFSPCCAHRVISKTYLHNGDADATAHILAGVLDTVSVPT